ncbi:hypothetical protein BO70DRAFT_379393 [Aspergillus heteromorphus CBS 117.55]|uniref:Uncharacterized protein n=1 Tax=Aspergillus heteromorphus CBS 117.55 TaxID=1448321 RepID=A0A317WAJ7_9EURO|nr:uncharacterized protein BO70DRAFT_379393 [Aspergillus heteromorphus CBS 117.55]PWY82821.1 hypothetical protein BO70DRAFT_379393 [Aspergillus heteromorphus CBS 117.55]
MIESSSSSSSTASEPIQEKKDTKGVDIIFDEPTDTGAMAEEKAEEIIEADNERIEQLMAELTKGFDPSKFAEDVSNSLPKILEDAFPGSFQHLLSLLLESDDKMHDTQVKLERWLLDRYPQVLNKVVQREEINISDETYFGAEIETLRKLVEPLRDWSKQVFWLNYRRASPAKARQHLEASVLAIELFKGHIATAMEKDTEDRMIYNPLPISVERTTLTSLKQLRIDACKTSLSWDGYMDSDIVLTRFFHAYKELTCQVRPEKAREWGWLPPEDLEAPLPSAPKARKGDLTMWPFKHAKKGALDMLLKTALWLAMARGLPAVHLYCDVARLFTTHLPSKTANEAYIRFLRHLAQIRVSMDSIRSAPPTPIPYKSEPIITSNYDFYDDVFKCDRSLTTDLMTNLTLYNMTTAKEIRRATARPIVMSARKRAQMIEKACAVEENKYNEDWPQTDSASGSPFSMNHIS